MEVGSDEYRLWRYQQLVESYDRIIASYQNRIHDLAFDNTVLRDKLKRQAQGDD